MSRETSKWLNNYQLIGFETKRGKAWHYRADDQGSESNHYPGAIPLEDVRRRLFFWEPVSATLRAKAEILTPDGVTILDVVDNSRQVIIRPDTQSVLGVFKAGYKIHGYEEWLIKNVETLTDTTANDVDGELFIAGAGLLKGGAVAWVQFEFQETREISGVAYRPFLTSFTSLDGSLATGYTNGAQLVVCDNTLDANISEAKASGAIFKLRHTKNSLDRYEEVRQALGIVHKVDENFQRQIDVLTNTAVSGSEWNGVLDLYMPLPKEGETKEAKRATTRAENKREKLNDLYSSDARVLPWTGTAFGVVQAINTYVHHEQSFRTDAGTRADRNALRMVEGGHHDIDRASLDMLNKVFASKRRKQITFA